jgi:hypothetical protein
MANLFSENKQSVEKAFEDTDVTWGGALTEPPPFLYHQFSFGVNKNFKSMFDSEIACLMGIAKAFNGMTQITKAKLKQNGNIDKNHLNDVLKGLLFGGLACKGKYDKNKQAKDAQAYKSPPTPPTPKEKKDKKSFTESIKNALESGEVEGSLTFGVTHPRCYSWLLDPRGGSWNEKATWSPTFEKFDSCTGEVYSAAYDEDDDAE